MTSARFVPLATFREIPKDEMTLRARAFAEQAARRRTVRQFSPRAVPRGIIEDCIRAAGTAPSGANLQPWHFVAVSDPAIKRRIRDGAEAEERAFYHGRAPEEWLHALEPFGTDEHKPFLEVAPWLIVILARPYAVEPDGTRRKHYYVQESIGIATGILITALHQSGLVTLTHTPSPMGFLPQILGVPPTERPFLLLVTGYPAPDAQVPDITRKPLDEIATFM